jgi:hypothetical protein
MALSLSLISISQNSYIKTSKFDDGYGVMALALALIQISQNSHEISLPKIGQKTLETLDGEIFAKANKKNQSKRKIALRFG